MTKIEPEAISGNLIDRIGRQWMLITAGTPDGAFNTMTASWGGLGVMWNRPAAFCVVRPQRHTFGFMEKAGQYSLSFYPGQYREALNFCGTRSGRDTDKPAGAGLRPVRTEEGVWTFEQAELTLLCRKLYADFLKEELFTDPAVSAQWYPSKDYHKLYIGVIEAAYSNCQALRDMI
ncbi:MAG: flavin reductase family protein [Oscillospiraceae bacterium]|nr:flavin reductase family protein [Oscillospiraceae bacterium]